MIVYVLLVAILEVQRSSSESHPFDNPFWVEWLRELKRSKTPSNSRQFGDLSTETVPLLQPLFPGENVNIIENGKVTSTATLRTTVNDGHINEHISDGQSSIPSTLKNISPISNEKSAINSGSFRTNRHILSGLDGQSNTNTNQLFEETIGHGEENRYSLNGIPSVLNSKQVTLSQKPDLQPVLSSFSNGIINDEVLVVGNGNGGDILKDEFRSSFVSKTERPLIVPLTTLTSTTSTTTETTPYSTTTRTLVASWPVFRSRSIEESRNKHSSRLSNRFRTRVPISSSRKSGRRNQFKSKRRQVYKRRRQTTTPRNKPTTTFNQFTVTTTKTPIIPQNVAAFNTRVSRRPDLSPTTTISPTTTKLQVSSSISTTSTTTSTTTTTTSTTTTHSTSTTTTPSPTVAATTSAATFVYTNLRTASALVVTRNVTSTRVVTVPIPVVVEDERETTTFSSTTEMTSTGREVISTTDSLTRKEDRQEDVLQYFPELPRNSKTEIGYSSTTIRSKYISEDNTKLQDSAIVTYDDTDEEDNIIPMPSNINNVKVEDPGVRSPRLTDWQPPQAAAQVQTIISGQYHEMNPGQYHEINPGQYHESNPGQYHETNPGQPVALTEGFEIQSGQYHEVNPGQPMALVKEESGILSGQYHEVNPGQYHEVNPGQYNEVNPGQYIDDTSHNSDKSEPQVEVEHTDNAKIYNVQQRVNEFIIGEYGTISNSGQTLQGVRYTAVADDRSGVDPNFIYETLLKYFPMAARKFAESNSKANS